MPGYHIVLDFGAFNLEAGLFDLPIATKFAENLPYTVRLMKWGEELYGSIGIDLGEDAPVPEIPPGGIAYTNNGNFVCIFFGQTPAWPVEHIGQIKGDAWKTLSGKGALDSVAIRLNRQRLF